MLQASVDGFGGSVGGVGALEVGQDVLAAAGQGGGQCCDLLQPGRDGLGQGGDGSVHQEPAQAAVGGAVGLDQALVDAPGGLERGVVVVGEQVLEARCLGIGEQVGPGAQGAPGLVERVVLAAPAPGGLALDTAAALIEPAGGQGHDVEGVHDGPGTGQLLGGGGPEPGEAVHGHHLDALAPCLVTLAQPVLESLPGPAWDHVQQAGRPPPVAHGGQVDDHRDVPVAPLGVAPDVLIDAQGLDPREAVRVLGDGLLGAGQDRGAGGVPGHS